MALLPSPTILVVDDREANLYLKRRLLERAGFRLLEAHSGYEALAVAAAHKPALIVLDVKLPDLSGFEVCQRIKRDPALCSILVLQFSAALISSEDKVRALEGGADGYLIEPVAPEELLATIRALLRLHGAEAALQALNAQLEARIETRTAELRQLAAEIVLAEQKERERIAQLLHDDLQQLLYGLQIQLNLLHTDVLASAAPRLVTAFQESDTLISTIIQLTRQLTVDLSPPVLQSEGLVEMLHWLGNHMHQMYGLTVAVEADIQPQLYSSELRIFLFQLVRELLFNVVKHAGVTQAQVKVQSVGDQLAVQVSDQGQGFDVSSTLAAPHAGGYGLRSIQHRLTLFDGQLVLDSQPGVGTHVTILLPRHPPSLRG